MIRCRRFLAYIAAAFLICLAAIYLSNARTHWIGNWFRNKAAGMIESSTGGKASIQSLSFNLFQLRLDVRGFVLRGLEPSSAAPLFQADMIRLYLRIAPFSGFIKIAGLNIDRPQAHVIVFPNGSTNIPEPKTSSSSNKSGLETVVDLAIGNFDLRNGTIVFADRKADFNADGRNLVAKLNYQPASSSYTGEIDISPLNLRSAGHPAIESNIKLPLTLGKDKVSVESAQVATALSQLFISASLEHLAAPTYTAHVTGRVALRDLRNAGQLPPDADLSQGPEAINLDLAGSADPNRIQIVTARLNLGQSHFEASGAVKGGNGARFYSSLDLAQLGRLLCLAQRPAGTLHLGGSASLGANNSYLVRANLDGKNISLREGTTRLNGIGIASSITAQPNLVSWTGLRVALLGGDLTGSGSLANSAQLQFAGNLRNFQTAPLARIFGQSAPYSGALSGTFQAGGDIKNPTSLDARANLAIAPVRSPGAIPISGRLNIAYNGRAQSVTLRQSYLALPHSRIDLAGSLDRRIQVNMTTRDFADFRPLAAIPVIFNRGGAVLNATITGAISRPRIAASASVTNFSVKGRPFTRFAADIDAARIGASIHNGTLSRGVFLAQFTASVGLRNWKPEPAEPLQAELSIQNGTLEDLLALAGETGISATGALTAGAHIHGTVGEPLGTADLAAANGTIAGGPFQSLHAQLALNPNEVALTSFQFDAAPARLSANATYRHASATFSRGLLRAHVDGSQVQLARFRQLAPQRFGLGGALSLNTDIAADVAPSGIELRSLNGNFAARGLQLEGRKLGDITASATTLTNAIQYQVSSDFAGSTIRAAGQTLLSANHETTATASIANLPIEPVLAAAGQTGVPATGTLSANANFSGTISNPQVSAGVTVTKGSAFEQPFDRLETTLTYTNHSIDIPKFQMTQGPAQVTFAGSFNHPAGDFQEGQVRFNLSGNSLQLAALHAVAHWNPGLAGMLRLSANGAATLRRNQAPLVFGLNADLQASDLSLNKKPLGYLTAAAQTRNRELTFTVKSNFALSDIAGSGRVTLDGDYPVTSQIRFSNITYSALTALTGAAPLPGTTASAAGEIILTGPIARPQDLAGQLQLTSIEARTAPQPAVAQTSGATAPRTTLELHNQGPVTLALSRSQITVQSAHITGTDTDLTLTGTADLSGPRTLNLHSTGSVKLEVLQAFNPEVYSAGNIAWNAAVTGTMDAPAMAGRLQVQNAAFNMLSLPAGLNNANGLIAFTGTEAVVQNLTGEVGGGKVDITGSVVYGTPMQFRLQAIARQVHVTYPETVTTEANARLALTGTSARSVLSGNVTILNVSLEENTDIGSILSAPTPPTAPGVSTGLAAGINFDVRIQTSPGVQFRANLAENVEATANLTLRGTAVHPGMLGSVSISQGRITFFGARYTIDQGSIDFFNPNDINPNINIELETTTQGVMVTLTVSGPMNRLKLSYRSSPPLRADEIIALLATGKQPSTDPVLAAYQPAPPQQSAEQQGLSALLGQGLANPVSSHLQKLFGVTRLSISPIFTGLAATPQATLTVVQQVTPAITFTYIQDVSSTNPLTIQMEWTINPRWSVIAQRDIYGELDLNFLYKKRFH
ncbi:MAG TPA: translocation/assembly module TamB domain-containing protein [Bryobacteraceae bacterium]|nr:translocation/assembly module TamB domain-containing protein [Bryobacteraceae bacterium]